MSALAAPVPPRAATERMTPKALWALAIASVAVFMVTLDNLVVTTAIPPLAVSVGAADPAVDGDADARRADRRRSL
jgi:hypothetical protein